MEGTYKGENSLTTLKEIKDALFPSDIYCTIAFIDDVGRDTKAGKVYTVHVTDDTTIMKLSIWNAEQLKPLKKGQKIMITKASVSIFQNEPQLSLTKDGKIDIIEG